MLSGSRLDLLETVRFATRHCHVGAFSLLWHMEEWPICPWCGDDFNREHMICECRGLSQERRVILLVMEMGESVNLEHMILLHGTLIRRSLRAASRLLGSMRVNLDGE